MNRADQIWNYPLYSLKRLPLFLQYSWQTAKRVYSKGYGLSPFTILLDMLVCNLLYGMCDSKDYEWFQFYKKSSSERNKFITKRRYFKIIHKFDRKLFTYLIEKKNMYEVYANKLKRDWMFVNEKTSDQSIIEFLKKHNKALIKPSSSEQGQGVYILELKKYEEALDIIRNGITKEWILEELLENCKEIKEINPTSLNTVRVNTLIDKNGNVNIMCAIMRVGAPDSVVDNWGAGGVAYFFDMETGVCCQKGFDKKNNLYVYHPGSNVQMVGFKLPRFEEMKKYVRGLALVEPKARYVGWDVAFTPDGFDLVEMNFPGAHDMMQTSGVPFYEFIKNNW